jgi:phosphoribosylglycinamide formyltransferase-1
MRLGLITYDAPHLKTEQVARRLFHHGRKDLVFFALPFVTRPARPVLFSHRPDMASGAHSRDVADRLGASFDAVRSADEIPPDAADLFLILGAGLLPPAFVTATEGRVLNSHPGIIPLVRGLDAFKWAIFDGLPVGNTLHLIDAEADAGRVLATRPTPVFDDDTLADFAARHYALEIDLMVDFASHLDGAAPAGFEERPARMRMPAQKEALLPGRFEAYRRRYLSDNTRKVA